MKKLHAVTPFVDEDVDITVTGITEHFIVDNAAQGMKTFPHIRRLAVKPVFQAVIKIKHIRRKPI